jgi:hypothetical protein
MRARTEIILAYSPEVSDLGAEIPVEKDVCCFNIAVHNWRIGLHM